MSTWRVEQHYGFGAARIRIQPEAHRRVETGFVTACGVLADQLFEGGTAAIARRLLGQMPGLLLIGLIFFTFITILARDHSDVSPIEVVFFDTPALEPEPVIEVVEAEPPKPVVPVRVPRRLPEPVQLAERPTPPRPLRREKPVIPQIAQIEAPKPRAPIERIGRSVHERLKPMARPRVAIDLVPVAPSVTPIATSAERVARRLVDLANPARLAPSLVAAPAPAPDLSPLPPLQRAFRVASAQATSSERPRALSGLAPIPRLDDALPQAPTVRAARSAMPLPSSDRRARGPTPAPGAARMSAAPIAVTAPERSARPTPREPEHHSVRPAAQLAAVSPAAAVAKPASAARSGREMPDAPRGSPVNRPGVAGVPLGELAACVQDRDEDRLKQAVVAAVTTQQECISSKGTYRFVETKNLNAFLMWIDRAPSRPIEDRCVELSYALECLENASRRAAR